MLYLHFKHLKVVAKKQIGLSEEGYPLFEEVSADAVCDSDADVVHVLVGVLSGGTPLTIFAHEDREIVLGKAADTSKTFGINLKAA